MFSTFLRWPIYRSLFVVVVTLLFFFGNLFVIYYFIEHPNPSKYLEPLKSVEKEDPYACTVTDSLAKSALERVKTESCRLKLLESSCKLKNGNFHDNFPKSSCPNFDSSLVATHVGCFSDSQKERSLKEFAYEFKTDNSREKCQASCYRAGFLYYGLEFGRECFCGDSISAKPLPQERCMEYTCSGNELQNCGGFNAVDVFRTGHLKATLNEKALYVNISSEHIRQDKAVRILFLLQLNGRNDRQVKRLLKAIYSPDHFYYIHVDQRQLYMLTEMRAVAAKLRNVYVAPDGHSTIWGGASLLKMVTDAIRRSISIPHIANWDYLFNMSESDFPVLSLAELEAQLTKNEGMSYLAGHGYNTAKFIHKQGFDYVFQECEERMWRIGKRGEFPRNLRIDGGSDWIVLHRKFAEYSVSNEELPTKMRNLFSSIILPVESFYHSLGHNSRFCGTIFSNHLRLTNWNRKQGCRCATLKKVVDWCGCSPLVFKKEHSSKFSLQNVISKSQYVARKFESLVDIEPIALAEAQAMRFKPHLLNTDHPSFNSTFVNFYKADIDGFSEDNSLLARNLLSMSSFKTMKFLSLQRIDAFKQSAAHSIRTVFTIQVFESQLPIELLVDFAHESHIVSPAIVDGYQLEDTQFGVNLDHKEEIFRHFTSFTNLQGSPMIKLRWKRLADLSTTVNSTKTCPPIKLIWRDAQNQIVAEQKIPSYDSIYGSQFSQLDLVKFSMKKEQAGIWSAIIQDTSIIANISFPVFDSTQIDTSKVLVEKFYSIVDSCNGDCSKKLWSTTYPDPKSDIQIGYMAIRPPADLRILESIIRVISSVSGSVVSGDRSSIRSVASELSAVSEDVIGQLPDVEYCTFSPAPVMFSSIYDGLGVHVSLFGFRRKFDRLPLHDHPGIHGFIKCLRGTLKIQSYSIRSHEDDLSYAEACYQGEKIITPDDGVVVVEPQTGNIHEIEALEDGSFFFDLLIPGYENRKCTYFKPPSSKIQIGGTCFLQKELDAPNDFFSHSLPYQSRIII